MADLGEMRVKVGADISEILSKVDAAKAKLNQLTESNQELKNKIKELNGALSANQKELNQADRALQKLIKSGEGGSAAAKELRTQIRGISSSTAELKTELGTTQRSLAANTTQIKAQTVAVRQAEAAGSGFSKGLNTVWGGLRKIAYIVPGLGIAGLVSLIAGPLIGAFEDWYKAITDLSDAQKTLKANLENYNDINEEANKNASKQITSLKILYDAATNVNLSMKDRLAAVKGLQNEFPDYFKNIKQESILNGNAKDTYNLLADSIIRTARAKAAINKLQEIGAKQLDNDIQKQKVLNATTNETIAAQKLSTQQQQNLGAGQFATVNARALELNAINARKEAALKIVEQNKKDLQAQADFITKFIGLSDLAGAVEKEIKAPKVKKDTESVKHVETIADLLQKLAIQIDFLNQKELLLKTSQAQAKINAIESTINNLMQKFRLQANDPIILKLEAKVQDINLTEQFKKDLKFDKNKPFQFPLPVEPELKLPGGTFDDIRYNLQRQLKALGVKTTKIGVPIETANITELNDTLNETMTRLESISKLTSDVLSPAFDALCTGILTNSDTAFEGFANAVKNAIVQLSAAVLKAAALAAIFTLINPAASFGGSFKKLLGFSNGGAVKGFATGGYIDGPGTKTSDSIFA